MKTASWRIILAGIFLLVPSTSAVVAEGSEHNVSLKKNRTHDHASGAHEPTIDRATLKNFSSIANGMINLSLHFTPTTNPESNYSRVSCNFSTDTCGWENVGGSKYPLTWKRTGNSYMHLYMKHAGNKKGRLASPWLYPLQNLTCQLQFQYYIQSLKPDNCQLSLVRETLQGEEEVIWFTQDSSGWSRFSDPIYQDINCTAQWFRMVFEGWKSCSLAWHNEIDIKSIKFTVRLEGAEPLTEAPDREPFTIDLMYTGSPATMVPDMLTTTNTDSRHENNNSLGPWMKKKDDERGQAKLTTGMLAGIIIAGVVVIVLVVVIVIVVCRRRRRLPVKSDETSTNQSTTRTVTNAAYMQANLRSPSGDDPAMALAPSEDNYDLVDVPPLIVDNAAPLAPQAHNNDGSNISGGGASSSSITPANDYAVISRHNPSPPSRHPPPPDQDVYDHLDRAGQERQQQVPATHSSSSSSKNNILNNSHPPPPPPPQTPASNAAAAAVASLGAQGDDDDTYDHTSRQPLIAAVPENTYDHATGGAPFPPPSVLYSNYYNINNDGGGGGGGGDSGGGGGGSGDDGDHDYCNQLQLRSKPEHVAAVAPGDDTYDHTITQTQQHQQQQQQQPASDGRVQPAGAKIKRERGGPQRNTQDSNSSAGRNVIAAASDYEIVDDVHEQVGSLLHHHHPRLMDAGDAYNLLDVRGERKRIGVVAENVYDHAI